ncbi:imidazole glycerol phosphate synthase subunit HisH [Micromonospora qiuiae]|uniref:Imidazole glycerol phosphate synthase subunit HisH n=1 Tax=Micromonospora qiuiae TaxID=502268 RepID=A0ABQ4J550_9ACTN|nr:imidazole glycerol phosphate synthase subunit HisH [Micromonospora qiuiae]GIJ25286.1 imidazole glycerol phosphate synthase subunit HisH [Micromonospora qiuiae]
MTALGGQRRRVVVLDHGSGNLRSAERALTAAGADVLVTDDLAAAAAADGLVVPGVGAFAACMAGIEALGAGPVIAERVAAGRPVLGICVGMQILFESGDEHGVVTKGLGLLPGGVTRLAAARLPHMGWNTVHPPVGSVLFAGLPADSRFYFVHSYAVCDTAALSATGARVTTAHHETDFVAAVERGALSAAQFHPEKSADTGAALLRNWLATMPISG